jgi:predicted transcriptional regulator
MNKSVNITAEVLSIATRARTKGITQMHIAEAIGASQSQVSRVLSGHISRPSRLYEEICRYVRSASEGVTLDAVRENDELIASIAATWDGSAHHAAALAAVIRSLGALTPSQFPKE